MKKRVLCYGDSNTWGFIPGTRQRYPEDVRWTGICQQLLGDEYVILEEGLSGRTTALDDPIEPDYLNGLKGLGYSLNTHKPVDLVVIMLGTTDLKYTTANITAKGAAELVRRTMKAESFFATASPVLRNGPRVLLVSPIRIHENIADVQWTSFPPNSAAEAARFPALYKLIAEQTGCHFLDAADYAEPSTVDCLHMSEESHKNLAHAMADAIRSILADL